MSPTSTPATDDRLAALLDAAVDGIVLIDVRGRITRFNHAAERMFGYDADEVLGQNISMLMPQPYRGEHDGYLQRYAETGIPRIIGSGREVAARRKDGSVFPIDLAVGEFNRALSADDDHGFVGFIRDISQRKQQERQLQESAEEFQRVFNEAEELRERLTHAGRLVTLGEMVSGIAHEVNQPLTAIASYASASRRLLNSGDTDAAELASVLDKISTQAERAGQVIRSLRKLARRQERLREPIDINALVAEVVRLVAFEFRNGGWQLRVELVPGLPTVRGDGVQIQQVILNLLRNAFEAMEEHASGDTVDVITRLRDGDVLIEVLDEGPGMSATAELRTFEPFYTTKPQGMGLGLSICKSIAAAHGGDLSYTRREGGGARFCLRLPVTED